MSFRIVKLVDPIQLNLAGGLNFQGDYDNATAYVVGDVVTYNGSSYAATQGTTGNLPTDVSNWQLLAEKGDPLTVNAGTNIDIDTISATEITVNTVVDDDAALTANSATAIASQKATKSYADTKVTSNASITGATKTKITYDTKGLVTAGADATTADIADSTNKRYVTDANLTLIGNTSGTNTGDNATNTQYSGLAASKQNADATLTSLAAYNTNGILTQTAADTFAGRTITGTTNQVTVTNGNGVSGNPTLSLPQDIHTAATPTFLSLTAGTDTDVIGTALSVIRNNVEVGRIDNNASGLRVQARNGSLQLRGTGNDGIAIDASGNAVVAGTITGANLSGTNTGDQDLSGYSLTSHNHTGVYAPVLGADDNYVTDAEKVVIGNTSGTNTGDNATNTQYSGLDAAKVNRAGDTMTGNLNMGTNKLIGGTGITDILKLQATTGNGTLTSPAIQLLTGNNGATTALTVLNNGNVGIGTTAPAVPLEVNGIVRADRTAVPAQYIQLDGGDGNNTALRAVALNKFLYIDNADISGANLYNAIVFRNGTAGDTERMRVDANGNVGIGTPSPGAQLQVVSSAAATIGQIIRGASAQTADLLQIQDSSANKLMVVSSGGNVGIGTISPGSLLQVHKTDGSELAVTNTSAGSAKMFIGYDSTGGGGTRQGLEIYRTYGNSAVTLQINQANSNLLLQPSDGNVGIGTTSPGEKLDVSGTVKATGYKSSDGSAGVSGSFTTTDGKTITIKDGLVVSIL